MAESPSVEAWILASVASGVDLTAIIITLVAASKFYRARQQQPLQKRSPNLVMLMNVSVVLFFSSKMLSQFSAIYNLNDTRFRIWIDRNQGNPVHFSQIFDVVFAIFYPFTIHGAFTLVVVRTWLFYFESKQAVETQSQKWSAFINPSSLSADENWFVKHRKTYGNRRLIFVVAILYCLVVGMIWAALIFFWNDEAGWLFDTVFYVLELIVIAVIWHKTPSFSDAFGMKNEIRWVVRLGAVTMPLLTLWTLKIVIFGIHLGIFITMQIILALSVMTLALLFNSYVFYGKTHLECADEVAAAANKAKLQEALNDYASIQLLFNQLSKEFSIELLLAFVEFKQFHDLMRCDEEFMDGLDANENSTSILARVVLADSVPSSDCVHVLFKDISDPDKKYLSVARKLFTKYVSHSAEHQINISYACRQNIIYFIQTYASETALQSDHVSLTDTARAQLFALYDNAADAIYDLMRSSYHRYIHMKQ